MMAAWEANVESELVHARRQSLKQAAVRALIGVQPISLPILGKDARRHYDALHTALDSGTFAELKEHLTWFIIYTQQDEGVRSPK